MVIHYMHWTSIHAAVAWSARCSKTQQIDEFKKESLLLASEEKSLRYHHEPVIGMKSLWIWPITVYEEVL